MCDYGGFNMPAQAWTHRHFEVSLLQLYPTSIYACCFCWRLHISITQSSFTYPHLHTYTAVTVETTTSQTPHNTALMVTWDGCDDKGKHTHIHTRMLLIWREHRLQRSMLASMASINLPAEASVSCMIQIVRFPKCCYSPFPVILVNFPHWPRRKTDLRAGHNTCTHHRLSTPWQPAPCPPSSTHHVQRWPLWRDTPQHLKTAVVFLYIK